MSGERVLRIVAVVLGSALVLVSLVAWFPFLGAGLDGYTMSDSAEPGATNQDIIEAVFLAWLMLWTPGMVLLLAGTSGWSRWAARGCWVLAVGMLALSGAAHLAGLRGGVF
ncbi:hypothetical protein [Saccharopolyspora griseoalba]|uniref:Uncharacterized protein n=1 Tax=Saccharopolyspora griseoalba TaxID=1431848 RepID=A0ABW2LQN1_9PSEU